MFAVNFYTSCFVTREAQLGKKTCKTRLGKGRLPAAIYASSYPVMTYQTNLLHCIRKLIDSYQEYSIF